MFCCNDPQITWDADTCLNVCISCGDAVENALVADSSTNLIGTQVVVQNSKQTAIRSKHGPAQHVLDGELSEHQAKCYTVEMHKLIGSLCARMSSQNLNARVCWLFDQSMKNEIAKFRWGGQAKAVSGVCLAIALRETNKPDRLKEIALLLGQKYLYLQRTLATLLSSLNIKLPATTPSHHIPNLHSHLYQELKQLPGDSMLNAQLYSQIKPIPLQTVAELSCTFLETFAMTSKSNFIQSSLSSCAVSAFVICLEGEIGKSLFEIKDLYKCFSEVCHLSADTLARPYRVMRQEVLKWMKDLDWAEQYRKGATGRADSSLRNVCARGLKDVLREINQMWRLEQRPLAGKLLVRFTLVDDTNSGEESKYEDPCSSETLSVFTLKNKKADACVLASATFLLNPFDHLPKGVTAPAKYPRVNWSSVSRVQRFSSPVSPLKSSSRANSHSSSFKSKIGSMLSAKSTVDSKEFHKALNYTVNEFPTDPKPSDYMNYLLSSNEPVSVVRATVQEKTTRMSLQTATLGAADAEAVPDDELLTNEEWEILQRTEEEQEQLQEYWNNVPGLMDRMERNAERAKKRKFEPLSKEDQDTMSEEGSDDAKMKELKFFGGYNLGMPDFEVDSLQADNTFEQSLGFGMDMNTHSKFFSGATDFDDKSA
ncbi:hypothetical protein J3R30DRAFT_70820 [Lentinula aciculospora]|uniref:Uncharacterized protein n=1 Tax=Lentinula aciculospora TaxID=153920 RepID=A0A9W9AWQ4_9AGAR|nr:hypothetical protein J3R30DRAFT_70820 [Lentinula aciculospora]